MHTPYTASALYDYLNDPPSKPPPVFSSLHMQPLSLSNVEEPAAPPASDEAPQSWTTYAPYEETLRAALNSNYKIPFLLRTHVHNHGALEAWELYKHFPFDLYHLEAWTNIWMLERIRDFAIDTIDANFCYRWESEGPIVTCTIPQHQRSMFRRFSHVIQDRLISYGHMLDEYDAYNVRVAKLICHREPASVMQARR